MIRMLISAAVHLAANAVGLLVAALVLEDMTVSVTAFVVAVAIFTVVEVIARPFFASMALKGASYLQGATALVTTLVGLIITAAISDGLQISGLGTWVAATLIVWLGALLASMILPVLFVKGKLEERSDAA